MTYIFPDNFALYSGPSVYDAIDYRLTIRLPQDPIVSISDTFSINDMFMTSHGLQFRPIEALLCGLNRPQPISYPFYERLELSWLAFNMYFLRSINDNFSERRFLWNQLLSLTEGPLHNIIW
jgi:hypothetical protein